MAEARGRHGRELCVGALGAMGAALVTFASVLSFGFVYDDHWTIEENRALSMPLRSFLRALLGGDGVRLGIPDATRPAMGFSLWLDRRLFGLRPEGYHLHSLVSYATCVAAAGAALFALSRRRDVALGGALLFAVMPVHAEVVSAVNYREDLIAATSVFVTLAYVFWPRTKPPFIDHVALVAAFLAFGLLGKESAVVVGPLVLALLFVFAPPRSRLVSHRTMLLVLLATIASFVLFRSWLSLNGADDVPTALGHLGPWERCLRTAGYLDRALASALVPLRVTPDHAPRGVPSLLAALPSIGVALLGVFLARRRGTRRLSAGIAILLVAPLATSPLVSPINEFADRYVFVSTLGSALIYAELGRRVSVLLPRRARPALLFLLIPIAFVSGGAAKAFRSDRALWEYAVRQEPRSARAFAALGRELRLSGDLAGAERAAERAIELDPRFLRARVVRVYNRLARGDVNGARDEIATIESLGGARQFGLSRARRCASLAPEEAVRCAADGGRAPAQNMP